MGGQAGTEVQRELSCFADTLPALVWTALADGEVDFVNRRWCEATGLSLQDARGSGWQTAIYPDDLPKLLGWWRSVLDSGEPSEAETRMRHSGGEYRWFLLCVNPLRNPAGQVTKWYGVSTDIEIQKRSEEALKLARTQILNGIPALVTVLTPAGEVEQVNRLVLEYFGRTSKELRGWATADLVHPDDLPNVIAAWSGAVETGRPYEIESRYRRADGVYRWFRINGFPLRDREGCIVCWYVIQTDVDARKRGELLLAEEKRFLEMLARGCPFPVILDALCRLVEDTAGGCYSSVVLVDPSGARLEHGAAPSLPASFITSIIGRPVNVDSGPCAMAAYLNEQVIAADLTSETRWAAYEWCPMALAHGLRACWSTPISSTAGKVLGAFAIYYDEPGTPTPSQQSLIEQFSHIASIAIERAQSDAVLKESEARKAAVLDSALDCIVTIDHEGCITEFNPAAERTFGHRRNDVIGKQLADVIIPMAMREKHRQGFSRFLATGEARLLGKRIEATALRADGSEFPVELTITRIPLEGPPSFTGYLRDLTGWKRSEEELRRSEAFLAKAQRLSSTGSFSWRVATGEIAWSETVYRIFEFEPNVPMTLELIASRVHPDDMPMMYDMLENARNGRNFEYEHRLQFPDRSVKYLHLVAHATQDQNGVLEYIGAVQDVTQRRISEEALGEVRSELAHMQRVTSLGALTASIAHEVNQPLSGIITNASTCLRMLAADPPNVEGALETARRTIRDGHRASDVIRRLRALFAKKSVLAESMDLNQATEEVIALSRSDLQKRRVILRPELAVDLPPVAGDRVQLQQVVLNLLMNASDAMSAIDDRPRQLVIRTERDQGDCVQLSVQDSGVGLEPECVDRVFEPFYTTKSEGMGIGLSVSRSIIERHHGRLWATPNDGPGATFFFSIPCAAEDPNRAPDSNDMRRPEVSETVSAARNGNG
ncbi:MAG TPA: PAS domain S-box protein [Bryobacteraceae bacterium]